MKIFNTIDNLRKEIRIKRNISIGFVPTMGALHDGHVALIHSAKKKVDYIIVSIYVNPAQFGPNEDFLSYPRTQDHDIDICKKEGVNCVFMPSNHEIYQQKQHFYFHIDGLADNLCGISRPHFFPGIALIVTKLLNIIQPNFIFLGQKDIQQYRIIEQLLIELNFNTCPILVPTIREKDGLALSSRNHYLSPDERTIAPMLYHSLNNIFNSLKKKPDHLTSIIEKEKQDLVQHHFKIDYLNLYHYNTLLPCLKHSKQWEEDEKIIIAGATLLGNTRLIDNLILSKKELN